MSGLMTRSPPRMLQISCRTELDSADLAMGFYNNPPRVKTDLHWSDILAIADHPNCVIDISNWNEEFEEHEGDLVARLATWRSLVGTERILFASDQPSGPRFTGERSTLKEWANFIRGLPENAARWGYRFTAEEAAAIMGGNAMRFYGLDGESRT